MLEILGIIFLSNINAKNAAARGRKPGGFRGMTIGLWFGGELLGFFIGMAATNGEIYSAYGVALLFAVIGGVASYVIAKSCKPGDYRPQQYGPPVNAQPLAAPCTLVITREKSFVGAAVSYNVFLNGQQLGTLKNGESIQVAAPLAQNTLLVQDAYGTELKPLYFALPPGGNAQILFNTMKILPERSAGIVPLGDVATVPASQPPQGIPGAPVQPQAPLAATAPPQPGGLPQAAAQPAQVRYAQGAPVGAFATPNEKPMVAVWVLCGALLFILLGAFTFFPAMGRSYYNTMEFVALGFPLTLGVCVYLMLQREAKYNLIAVGGIICGMLFNAFSATYLNLYATHLQAPPFSALVHQQVFFLNVRSAAVSGAIVAAASIIVALAYKGPPPKNIMAASLAGAGAMLAYRMFNMRYLFMTPDFPGVRKAGFVISNIGDSACIVLFALLIWMVCTLGKDKLVTGTGAKIWFGICAGATLIVAIVGLANRTVGIVGALVALAGVGGYALLLLSKRVGFPIVLGVVLMNVLAGIGAGFLGYQPSVLNGLVPLIGLINPLITWLLIRGAWGSMPRAQAVPAMPLQPAAQMAYPVQAGPAVLLNPAAAAQPAAKIPAKGLFVAGGIINILVGGTLFVAALYSMVDEGRIIPAALAGGTLLGGVLLALGILAVAQCLGKKAKVYMWLLIVQLAFAGIIVVTAIFGVISSLL